jgi:hypothetical protein
MHMMLLCPFAASVWQGLENWIGTQPLALPVSDYWKLKTWRASWYTTEDSHDVTQKSPLHNVEPMEGAVPTDFRHQGNVSIAAATENQERC